MRLFKYHFPQPSLIAKLVLKQFQHLWQVLLLSLSLYEPLRTNSFKSELEALAGHLDFLEFKCSWGARQLMLWKEQSGSWEDRGVAELVGMLDLRAEYQGLPSCLFHTFPDERVNGILNWYLRLNLWCFLVHLYVHSTNTIGCQQCQELFQAFRVQGCTGVVSSSPHHEGKGHVISD